MRIPETIKIGGITYKVNQYEAFTGGDTCDGHFMVGIQEIQLLANERHQPQYVEAVFIHELLHAILHHAQFRIPGEVDEESLLDCLALGLHQIIVDNPETFRG